MSCDTFSGGGMKDGWKKNIKHYIVCILLCALMRRPLTVELFLMKNCFQRRLAVELFFWNQRGVLVFLGFLF